MTDQQGQGIGQAKAAGLGITPTAEKRPEVTQPLIKEVLLALDGTGLALAALPVAQAMARLLGTALHVVQITEKPVPVQKLLERLSIPSGIEAVFHTSTLPPAEGIRSVAEHLVSPVIVMTPHCGHPQGYSGLGSVAYEMLRMSFYPILLVPPGGDYARWHPTRLLLPQNGSPGCAQAIHAIQQLLAQSEVELLTLNVMDRRDHLAKEAPTLNYPRYLDQPQYEWPGWAREFLAHVQSQCGCEAVKMHFFLAVGEPSKEIVHFAETHNVDMIVLPWHRHLGPGRAHTLKTILRNAPCPILLIPFAHA